MSRTADSAAKFGFDKFELDVRSGELRADGKPVKLQLQPFKVLAFLVARAGQVVTRDEIRQHVWGEETFVDYEQGLNYCIREVRAALGEDAANPRYIETCPRRGYRFLIPVEELPSGEAPPEDTRKVMLAVLPFENLSGHGQQEYFSDGLTEEMITQLGRLQTRWLGVIARTSSMKYKHTDKGIDQIGRELAVQYVLEGSVRRAAGRVRITAQLIQVSHQTHVWAESYDRDLRDILALQNDVAQAIANEIRIKLAPQEQARLSSARRVNSEAYEAYLKGRYFWNKRTKQALQKGVRYFEKALEIDPDYAPAYAGLADSYYLLGNPVYGALPPKEAFSKANVAALKALQIDKTLAEAHASLAQSRLYEFNWLAAEKEFRRSIELSPGYATAHHWYSLYLSARGRFGEALAEAKCACLLDPLSVIMNRDFGLIYYYSRQPERAIEQYRKTLELDPMFALAHQALGRAYLDKGMYDDAVAEIETAVKLSGGSAVMLASLAHVYVITGKTTEATKILGDLTERSRVSYVSPTSIAVIYAGLGDKENTLDWLEKACEERDVGVHTLKVHPIFDSQRSEPRFHDLLRRVGLGL